MKAYTHQPASRRKACPFLDIIPLEIREIIYSYVLVVKTECDVKSGEYDRHREEILDGGDHTYRLHTSILYTNCQTYHEAWQTFDREHLFVLVAFPQDPWMLTALEQYGLPTIAQGERARQFPNIAMTLTFGVAGNDDWWPGGMRDRNVVIAIQDLSALCTSLLGYKCQLVDPDDILTLYIRIAPRISPSLLPAVDDRPNPQSKLRRLLEPLRQLHSTEIIKIEGPSSLSYMQEIVEGTSGPPDNINEVLKKVLLALSGGDEARDHSDLSLAVVRYKSGLQTIHSHFGDYEDPWEMRPTYRAIFGEGIRLQTRLAACYFKMNKLRIARIYAERVYRSKHSVDNRCHREKTPLMSIEPGRETLYAKTMVIAAQISYAHGHMREAIRELNEAHRLEPLDHSGEQLLAKVTEHREVLQKRDDARYEGWVLQLQKEHEKVANAIEVALTRRNKAEEAFRSGNFAKALSKYQAAADKMQSLGPSFAAPDMLVDKMPGLPLDEPLAGIALIHLSRIVSSYLGLAAYEEVNEHANRPLDKILRGITVTKVDWVDFARPYYQVIYYCKALALEKLGRLDEAIRSAEGALKCDPDDGCVLSTLKALRKAQEVEKSKRDHASAKDVRRRQNKKRKALAKKARGIGFITGVALL